MSEFQKQQRPGNIPIKNPLLSASVTGLTYDDFPNKPLLLPAAPPSAHPPIPSSAIPTSGLVIREPKSLVTVGSSSLDTENLDEINLNTSSDDNQTTDVNDPNANPLLELSNQAAINDSILSQAATSFSALPSVASNVFSTFSKRITSISSRETTPINEQYQQDSNANISAPQIDIQPAYIQLSHPRDLPEAAPQFYAPPFGGNALSSPFVVASQQEAQANLPLPEHPKLYTPAEVPPVPLLNSAPPTNLGGNNFRFSSKKKLYAPIPGLSDQPQKPTTTLDPISYNSTYEGQTSQYSTPEEQKSQEPKLGSGLFSKISNLAPTGVLQNLTGLVQTAAESLSQTNKTDFYREAPPPPPTFDQQNNFVTSPPASTNYFASPLPRQTTDASSAAIAEQTTQNFSSFSAQQSGTSLLFASQPNNQESIENSFQIQPQTQIPLFQPTQISQNSGFHSIPQASQGTRPPSNLSSTAQLPPDEKPAESISTHVNFFDPIKYSQPISPASVSGQANLTSHSLPPIGSSNTSYRLQKGTKLYKNPLTPQETAENTHSSQQTFATVQSVPLFAPPPILEQKSSPYIEPLSVNPGQSTQEVPLFAAPYQPLVPELSFNNSPQSVPLFNPAAKDTKSEKAETIKSYSLFGTTNNPLQEYSPVGLQVEELKSELQTSAPPTKKLKPSEANVPEQSTALINQKPNLDPSELFENKTETSVPNQDSNVDIIDNKETDQLFQPIEPVLLDENINKQQEGATQGSLDVILQKLSLTETTSENKNNKLPPIADSFNIKNPYRKGSATEATKPTQTIPTLANFFTPETAKDSNDLNFFATFPSTQSINCDSTNFFSREVQINKENSEPTKALETETTNFFTAAPPSSQLTPLEPHTAVHPPISAFFPTSLGSAPAVLEENNAIAAHLNKSFAPEHVPPPLGFENSTGTCTSVQKEKSQAQQPEIVNRFSNYFNQTNQQQEKDSFIFYGSPDHQQQQVETIPPSIIETSEEQRIQYFFNNPPPKDASNVGDLNYDLVHSGLAIKNLQQRSLTPISNLVEPPSSACSEFSEISNSTAGQKSIAANLSITESEKEENNKNIIDDGNSDICNNSVTRYEDLPEEILQEFGMTDKTSPTASVSYKPAVKHWFFKRTIGEKHMWVPFSHYDSALLETSLLMEGDDRQNIVAVEGGRYDVNISERKKSSVYWESQPIEVRRCSWFYKAIDSKYVPYEEQIAEMLESEYKQAAESGVWHKTIALEVGEQVVFHGPTVIVHFQQQQTSDAWGGTTQTATRPRVVKRDLDDFNIEQGESQKVDHLLFMVHGIGSACDLKLRSVEEVVEDFRTIAHQLVQSHYKNSTDMGLVGRVEVLPISWHSHLHSAEMGIDEKLRLITLESIPKLRNFTNDTLLDILFYSSPTFCQKIMNTIVSSLNTLYLKYRERHPEFNGGVSLAGHSLGSLILFDLLCHQNPIKESEEKNNETPDQFPTQMDTNQFEDKQISYTMGPAGTGQPFINYGQLIFQPKKFFALGSPIGMFVTIRGIDKLGLDFRLPTCPGFYNIFHPYDPVAYRIEALVNPDLSGIRPVLIPHHKGRKRMHLELKETMTRVSADLKNRFLDKFKTTLDSVNIFSSSSKTTKEAEELMEKEVNKVIQMQIDLEQPNNNKSPNDNVPTGSDFQNETTATSRQRTDSTSTAMSDDLVEIDFPLGKLNDSKRIDYVLQEAPFEFINEYIFALSSHVCYWDSEDTILFVMKEIYSGLGISPDSQVPQQTMTIERPSSRNSLLSSS